MRRYRNTGELRGPAKRRLNLIFAANDAMAAIDDFVARLKTLDAADVPGEQAYIPRGELTDARNRLRELVTDLRRLNAEAVQTAETQRRRGKTR